MSKKQGQRGPDKQNRKLRYYPPTVTLNLKVPKYIADWLRKDNKPSKAVVKLVIEKLPKMIFTSISPVFIFTSTLSLLLEKFI